MQTVTDIPRLPRRNPESHKGDHGRVLIIGGSVGMAGAPCLAANAAYRSGAGLVKLAVPEPIQNPVSVLVPLATNVGLPVSEVGTLLGRRFVMERLAALAEESDVVVIGPGLGREPSTDALIRDLISEVHKPMVVDADGLRALGPMPHIPTTVASRLVMTPHPGEFAFLTGSDNSSIQADRRAAAEKFVAGRPLVLALKGHDTIVTDGKRMYVNHTGNPGMATGGSGDVLCGVIAALIGQHLDRFDAAMLGVHIHGAAGDAAAREFGEVSLTAADIIDYLPAAFGGASNSGPLGFGRRA